jgi:hypothetical protein
MDEKTESCVAVMPGTLKVRRCDGPPPRPPKRVEGTSILYGLGGREVRFAR